ncbi:MAG: hypothetical protein WDN10_04060 [bacterium]
MNPLVIWLLAYALPAFLAGCYIKLCSHQEGGSPKNLTFIHVVLLVSALASQCAIYAQGISFPTPGIWFLVVFAASVAIAGFFIGRLGLLYGVSALLQQACMLSIAFLLLPAFPVWIVVLLIVPLFVFCHQLTGVPYWRTRIILITLWGSVSVLIFAFIPDILLVSSLHTLFGTILIANGILHIQYERSRF